MSSNVFDQIYHWVYNRIRTIAMNAVEQGTQDGLEDGLRKLGIEIEQPPERRPPVNGGLLAVHTSPQLKPMNGSANPPLTLPPRRRGRPRKERLNDQTDPS